MNPTEPQFREGLVSIVTPMFNGAEFVTRTIESVLCQTYQHWEMLIVDDCSTDGGDGRKIVAGFQQNEPRIKLISLEKNSGSSGARNAGIEASCGEFLAFLDADDLWQADFLERQLTFMQEMHASIVFSSYRRIDEVTEQEILRPFRVPAKVRYSDILKSLPIAPSTAVLHQGKIGKHYFRQELGSVRDDYVFWLSLLKDKVDSAYGNQEVLASYRIRKNSVTARKHRVILPHWNVLRKNEGLPLPACIYYLLCWMWISFWKYNR